MIWIEENSSLRRRNTFGMNVRTRIWAEYESAEDLRKLLQQYCGERMMVVGAGSNLLFTGDYDGVLLHSAMRRARVVYEDTDYVDVEADGGLVLDELIAQVVDMGLGGLENLSHIPGEVGASAVQNVGAYGVEAKDVIQRVNTVSLRSGEERVFDVSECGYGYRDSIFKNELRGQYAVMSVVYRLHKHPELRLDYGHLRDAVPAGAGVQDVREAVIRIRQEKLPEVSELGSAGSFFKNPVIPTEQFESLRAQYPAIPSYSVEGGVKVPAAWLIEQCGWKGKSIGGARVYERQPLVIVNSGDATPEDVMALARAVRESVETRFGIQISPEVNYI